MSAFQVKVGNSTWIPGAGGYVDNSTGKLISTTPVYGGSTPSTPSTGGGNSNPGGSPPPTAGIPASTGGRSKSTTSSNNSSGSSNPTAYLYANGQQIPVTMINGQGYIGGQRITEVYPNIQWNSTGGQQQPGGAYGYYTLGNNQQPNQPNPQFKAMERYLDQFADGYVQNQKAQLDRMKAQQVNELQKLYQEAIEAGQISIRDAEQQFNEGVKAIEKRAYQDSELTNLHAQSRGIQNSQQMVGLMQGDQIRRATLENENLNQKNIRINNIKDRLNTIKIQKDLDIAKVNSAHDIGMLQAQGQAGMMKAQNMFDLMKEDYSAHRNQQFNIDNMLRQHGLDINKMYIDNDLALTRMSIGYGYDLEKMAKSFEYDVKKLGIQNNHAMSQLSAKFKMQLQAEQDREQRQLETALRSFDPNTKEGQLRIKQEEEASKQRLNEFATQLKMSAYTDILNTLPAGSLITGLPGVPDPSQYFRGFNKYNPFAFNKYKNIKTTRNQDNALLNSIQRKLGLDVTK